MGALAQRLLLDSIGKLRRHGVTLPASLTGRIQKRFAVINVSGISKKRWIGRALRLLLGLLPRGLQVPILQGPLRGYRWIVGSGVHGYWLGTYELQKQLVFSKSIKAGMVVFDVGAHVGFYTMLASVAVGDHGEVIAFEPFPENVDILRRHIAINNRRNVQIVEAAVGDQNSTGRFKRGGDSFTGRITENGDLSLPLVTLDDLVSTRAVRPPQIIKMDIEGGEYDALVGAQNLLKTCRPQIFLSTHGPDVHTKCISLLQAMGYDLVPLHGSLESTDELIASFPPRRDS